MFSANASERKIYVPAVSVKAYRTAQYWSAYADAIVPYDFEKGEVVPEETPKPANNEIWYTNGSTTEPTEPYDKTAFGATYLSNSYDAEKECWVIKFDGEVTMIGEDAFYGCWSLTRITIPDGVTSIGKGAFFDCESLTSVTIPDSVIEIGESAFDYCYSLTSITIPDSVTEIGHQAFYNCSSLASITIPDSVISIGSMAFCCCESLERFEGKFASEDGRHLIVDGVLNSFAIGCGITEYTIPDSVTTIGDMAFYACESLTSITIPDSVDEIGHDCFSNCRNIESVYCKAKFPPMAYFPCIFTLQATIYVPTESVDYYKKNDYWSVHADQIYGYNFE